MKITVTGLDQLQKDLKKMKNNAEKLSQKKQISFSELVTPKFMRKYTKFSSIDELLDDCGYGDLSKEEFEARPDIDTKISERTKFKSWQEMLDTAVGDYASSQLLSL